METNEIRETLKKISSMKIVGFIAYPSIVVDDDETGFEVNDSEKEIYLEVKGVFNAFFEDIKKKSRKKLLRYKNSTIVLEDIDGKRWYFNALKRSFALSSKGCRQGWDYEFDPEVDDDFLLENHLSKDNLWFC